MTEIGGAVALSTSIGHHHAHAIQGLQPLSLSSHDACARPCVAHDSLIVLKAAGADGLFKPVAGLIDRANVLHGAANLATSLCARLVPPTPAEFLDTAKHNRGRRMDERQGWERYFHTYRNADGAGTFSSRRTDMDRLLARRGADAAVAYNATSVDEVVEQYVKVARLAAKGKTFVWTIAVNYWLLRKPLEDEIARLHGLHALPNEELRDFLLAAPPSLSGG